MTLTADDATKLWPICDQYIQETTIIDDDHWAMIKNHVANYNATTDQHAQDHMNAPLPLTSS